MRTWIVVVSRLAAALAIAGLLSLTACSPDEIVVAAPKVAATVQPTAEVDVPASAEEQPRSLPEPIGVDELMQNPELHSGVVRVRGVVSAVGEEDQSLALIDLAEYEDCAVTTCASLALPVRWFGTPPEVERVVELIGDIQDESGKLIFVATDLKLLDLEGEG